MRKFITVLILVVFIMTQIFAPVIFAGAKEKLDNVKAELEGLSNEDRGKVLSSLWDHVVEKIGEENYDIDAEEILGEIKSSLGVQYDNIIGEGTNQIKEETLETLINEILDKDEIVKTYYDTYENTYKKYSEKPMVKDILGLEPEATSGQVYAKMMDYVVPLLAYENSEFVVNNDVSGVKGGLARKAELVSKGDLAKETVERLLELEEDTDGHIEELAEKLNGQMDKYNLQKDDVTGLFEIFGLYDNNPNAPLKISTTPADNSTGIGRNPSIKVTYDKKILNGDGFESISLKQGSTELAINKNISGKVLTITAKSELSYSTQYTVTIPGGAITDEVMREAQEVTFKFTTKAAETTPEEPEEPTEPKEPTEPEEPEVPEEPSPEEKEIRDIIEDIDLREIDDVSGEEVVSFAKGLSEDIDKVAKLIKTGKIESPKTVIELTKALIEKSAPVVDKLESLKKVVADDKLTDDLNDLAKTALKKVSTFKVDVAKDETKAKATVKLGEIEEGEIVGPELRKILKDVASTTKELETTLKENGLDSKIKPTFYLDATLDDDDEVSDVSLDLPSELLMAAEEEGISYVTFVNNVSQIRIPSGSIKLEKGKEILVQTNRVDKDKLSDKVKETVGDNPVYDFSISVDGKGLEFEEPIQVSIPYTPLGNIDTEKVTVFYIGEDGSLENVIGVYDEETGMVTFETRHFSQYLVKVNDIRFLDVPGSLWSSRFVEVMASKGVIKGVGADMFNPYNNVTRAEFLAMVVREFNLFDKNADNPFTDVKESDWFYPEVVSGAKYGIVQGRPGGIFAPGDNITREEMATILSNVLQKVLGKKAPSETDYYLENYADNDNIADYAKSTVAMATMYEIVAGKPGGLFAPKDNADRSEAAKVIYMLFYMR